MKDHIKSLLVLFLIYTNYRLYMVAMRIQQLCAEHGYNLNQLARSCGVPPSTVKNIIHGASHNPGIVTIKLLCDGLGISLYDFFNTDDFRQHEQELK